MQELRKHKRRPTRTGKQGLFSGLLYCADCGAKLYYCTSTSYSENQDHYVCSNYKSNTGSCSIHFIRQAALSGLVLDHLKQTIQFVQDFEDEFVRAVMDKSLMDQKKELSQKRRELAQAERRIAELDTLFQRIYEDNISGKLTDERFSKLSTSYEAEQRTLTDRANLLHSELDQEQEQAVNVAQFIALVRKYTNIQELTPAVLNEFIERIIVHSPDRSTGHRTQKIDIVYNFVGQLPMLQEKSGTA